MTLGVVIFTYNRPKMLAEALASALRNKPDRIIICDDGSEPPVDIEQGPLVTILRSPRRTPEERKTRNLSGYMGNIAREKIGTDYIAWLCDDDLMADGWLDHVRQASLAPLYIGGVEFFEDPVHGTINWKNFEHSPSEMTTGNWVERTDLMVRWENRAFGADAIYVWDLLRAVSNPPSPVHFLHDHLALHYRNHNLTLSNLLKDGGKDEQFKKGTME